MFKSGNDLTDIDIIKALLYSFKKQKIIISKGNLKGIEKKLFTQMVDDTENLAIMIKKGQIDDFEEVYNYVL